MDIKNEFFVIFSTEFGNRFACYPNPYILTQGLCGQRFLVEVMFI